MGRAHASPDTTFPARDGDASPREGEGASLLEFPFDHYQRFRPIGDIVDAFRRQGGGGKLDILDIGGAAGHLTDFLPRDRVVVSDPEVGEASRVLARGEALPFRDRSFDVAVCIDTLEHVPSVKRAALLGEAARVARGLLLVAAPFDELGVREAESFVETCHQSLYGKDDRWLREHEEHGLPSFAETLDVLTRSRPVVKTIPNGYLPFWRWTMALNYLLLAVPESYDLYRQVNVMVNRRYYSSSHREPSYRKILVAVDEEAPWLEATLQGLTRESRFARDGLDRLEADTLGLIGEGLTESISDKLSLVHDLEDHISGLKTHLEDLMANLEAKERALERADEYRRHLDHTVSQKGDQVAELENYIKRVEEEFAKVDQLVNEWGVEREELKRRNADLEEQARTLNAQIEELRAQLEARQNRRGPGIISRLLHPGENEG